MVLKERFINYTRFDTQSREDSSSVPSTPEKQLAFARFLAYELENEGLSEIELDDMGYIYATLPANLPAGTKQSRVPTVGFIAHYDTSPDASGAGIKAREVTKYDGGDIILSEGIVSSPRKFPELLKHVGEDLIVTDGTTLLGADDKAGIAEIVQAMVYLKSHPEIHHGKIRIAFNPDEEIGLGAKNFNVKKFGCSWAYTVDGGDLGELEYENFNAAAAKITINGVSVHPGYAKDKMLNASMIANELINMLPQEGVPETRENYEGFYHLVSINSTTECAKLHIIIRDHDRFKFLERKGYLQGCVNRLNAKYGLGTVVINLYDQYQNMKEIIKQFPHTVEICQKAMEECGVQPVVKPIRGGTDGAQLSYKGLPCPIIFEGGVTFHGPHVVVSVQT